MRILALTALIWSLATATLAQDRDAIEDVIGSQLQAFNERDVDTAWTFASPMIQRLFGNSANFGAMVQNGYPMVWDNRDTEFLDLEGGPARFLQRVFIRDTGGAGWILEYEMIETAQGWRINGVRVLPAPEMAA